MITGVRYWGCRLIFSRSLLLRAWIGLFATLGANPGWALVNAEPVGDQRFAAFYPWAVVVVNPANGGLCGGTLIDARWVLTAAHCTGGGRHVLVGSAERSDAQRIEVERAVRHPEYSLDSLQNDVGLLYLAEAVAAPYAELATEITGRLLLRPRVSARIIGWGKTETSATPVDRLHEARVYLEDYSVTGSRYLFRASAGPCARDSGSPMVMRTLDGRWLVVGIATATDGNLCASGGGRSVYTSLYRVRDFIVNRARPDSQGS